MRIEANNDAALLRQTRGFHTKKRLGQHFLIEPEALEFIADNLHATNGDTVVEIGPGLGFLTKILTQTGARIIAVELDRECIAKLQPKAPQNLTLVHMDFLAYDLSQIDRPFKVVGNVPYQITTPIVARLFGEIGSPSPWFDSLQTIILTVQLEVANRFVARPDTRDYSQITLLTNYFCQAEILRQLPRESFSPPPKVNSAIVRFTPLPQPTVACKDHKLLRKLIAAGFSQRRKMLRNNLGFLHLSDIELSKLFQATAIDPQARAERLSLQDFARLADAVEQIRAHSK